MKKILLALAVVSMVLPMSAMADDTTIYGQFRYSIADVTNKDKSIDGIVTGDNTSLLGVKGSYGDDINAFFHLQMGARTDGNGDGWHEHGLNEDLINNDTGAAVPDGKEDVSTEAKSANKDALTQRFFYAGLKGSFGKVQYGRLTNAYKMPGFKMDPLYNTSHLSAAAAYNGGGATYGLSGATNGFTDNSLEYHSPKIAGGVTVNLGVYLDDSNEDDHNTGAGVTYSANGITAGIQTIQNAKLSEPVPGTTADESALRIHASYKGEGFKVGVSRETVATATADPTYTFITGTYGVAEKTDIVATIGIVDADVAVTDNTAEGTGFTLSVFHGITNNTKVFASYASVSLDSDTVLEDNPTALSFGVQHKFSTSN